jgi:Ca2+-binding RTX toxin-like protein
MNESNGNLRLQASSPLIDRGVTCSRGGVAGPDAAQRSRIHGKSVDIGAFEFGAGPAGEVIVGTNGPDIESGGPHADILCGYGGKDKLIGAEGNDYLDGGAGNDTLRGGPGLDRLFGRDGNDRLCAKDGVAGDVVDGGPGTDSFQADPGDRLSSVEVHATC